MRAGRGVMAVYCVFFPIFFSVSVFVFEWCFGSLIEEMCVACALAIAHGSGRNELGELMLLSQMVWRRGN